MALRRDLLLRSALFAAAGLLATQAQADTAWNPDRAFRVPGGIGLGGGGDHAGSGEKGRAKQQIATEGHGGEFRVCLKNFSLKSRKTSRKKILFS